MHDVLFLNCEVHLAICLPWFFFGKLVLNLLWICSNQVICVLWFLKWSSVYFQRLPVSFFHGKKASEIQYSTLKNEPRVNFESGSKYVITPYLNGFFYLGWTGFWLSMINAVAAPNIWKEFTHVSRAKLCLEGEV